MQNVNANKGAAIQILLHIPQPFGFLIFMPRKGWDSARKCNRTTDVNANNATGIQILLYIFQPFGF